MNALKPHAGPRVGAVVSLVASVSFLAAMSQHKLCSFDVWIHLSAGRHIVATGHVTRTDPFSYGAGLDRPWVAHEWLAQLLMYGAHRVAGAQGLVGGQTLAVAAGALAGAAVAAKSVGWGWAAAVPALVGLLAYPRLLARPEALAFLCAGLLLWWLSRFAGLLDAQRRRDSAGADEAPPPRFVPFRWLAGVALVQAVWANSHPSFPVGVALCGAFAVAAVFDRPGEPERGTPWRAPGWLAAAAVVAAAAAMANPNGPALWLHPFRQMGATAYMQGLGEWKSVFSADVGGPWRVALGISLAAGAAAFVVNFGETDVAHLLVFAVAGGLACLSARHVGLSAFLLAPVVVAQCGRAGRTCGLGSQRWHAAAGSVGLAGLCLAGIVLATGDAFHDPQKSSRHWGAGLDPGQYPVEAADFVEQAGLQGAMFNNYDIGGYLMWRLGPERRVFIDGRNMVHGEDAYRRYRASLLNWPLWCALARERGFEWVIVRHTSVDTDRLLHGLYRSGGWALCHYDAVGAVFVKRQGVNAAAVREHEIALADLPPGQRRAPDVAALLRGGRGADDVPREVGLAGFFRKIGLHARAAAHLEAAVESDPGNPQTVGDLGGLCLKLGFLPQAEDLLRAALALDPGRFSVRVNLAKACALERRYDEAVGHYGAALRQRPGDPRLRNDLATVYAKQGDLPRAAAHYRQAIALAPSYRLPAYNLASILMGQGHHDQAAAVCRQLLRGNPQDSTAKSLLERVTKMKKGR